MKTINPFLMFGSYFGALAGLGLFLIGWHPFWWVAPLFGVEIKSLVILDFVGGFVMGYIVHILSRVFNYHIDKIVKSK